MIHGTVQYTPPEVCVCVCVCTECTVCVIHVCSRWYLLWVALAVFADGWRRGVVVEDRTGEVVDHQHLPLQCILDQERYAVQPLALLEHIHTHTHTHIHTHTDTYTRDAGRQTGIARRRKHVHMRTCEDKEHAGKCIHHRKGYKTACVHTQVCFYTLCTHTQMHTHVTHVHIHP